jgi:hypothetical protein
MAGKASWNSLADATLSMLNKKCARKIFAEGLPAVAARKARETMRLCALAQSASGGGSDHP